jgi:hypothetical protein
MRAEVHDVLAMTRHQARQVSTSSLNLENETKMLGLEVAKMFDVPGVGVDHTLLVLQLVSPRA